MGNSCSTSGAKDTRLVSIDTDTLKLRLNQFYRANRQGGEHRDSMFEYLWDIKEMALMEGRNQVEVPSSWLDELENSYLHRH